MYKILIAEDEPEMRKLLVKYMKQEEPELEVVGSATNGKEALELVEALDPDIVITDIFMPIMSGLEFLKKTQERNIPMKAIIISGYDEFEYAKTAIGLGVAQYLLKPFDPEELKAVLDKVKKELDQQQVLYNNMKFLKEQSNHRDLLLKERILRDILAGKPMSCELEGTILDAKDAYYCVCLLKLPLYTSTKEWPLSKQEHVEELVALFSEGCLHKDMKVQGLSFEGKGAILILSGGGVGKQPYLNQVKESMLHLQRSLEKYYNMQIICVIGGIYEQWEQLHLSYEETLQVWRGMVSFKQTIIVCGKEQDTIEKKESIDAEKQIRVLKEQIILAVRMGKEKEFMEQLEQLMQVYALLAPKKTDYVSISAEEFVYAIFNEMEQLGIRLEEERENEAIQRQMKAQLKHASLLEVKELLIEYFEICHKSFLKNKEKQQAGFIVENVKYIVECQLDFEGLTLEWIAEKVHFSPTYVRQVFKQKTGERIMEYIIRKRMEKAGKLLSQTDMLIHEIAVACGYSNQRYFASSFKKYYDCTPTNFKALIKE